MTAYKHRSTIIPFPNIHMVFIEFFFYIFYMEYIAGKNKNKIIHTKILPKKKLFNVSTFDINLGVVFSNIYKQI